MPIPETRQTQMSTFNGLAPGVDDNHFIPKIAFLQNVVSKTADYSPQPSESGTVFHTGGATAGIEFTLPAVADSDGVVFWFFNAKDSEMLITAPNETLIGFNDATADGISFTTASNQAGNGIMLICDGAYWYAGCMPGDDTVTITLVSA